MVHAINAGWIIKIKVKRKRNKGSAAAFMTGKRETQHKEIAVARI